MKITRMDLHSTQGCATISRRDSDIVINVELLHGRPGHAVVSAKATAAAERRSAARRLQVTLDGCYGTREALNDYLRAIETFAD